MNGSDHLGELLDGHVVTQLIASAVRFGIPDHLSRGALTDVQLSELTGIGVAALQRYLPALQGLGLVEPAGPGQYRGTPLIDLFRSDTGALHGHALAAGAEYYEAWMELDHALRTGRSAFERRHGHDLWTRLDADGEAMASFTRTMRLNTERALEEIAGMYEFPATGLLADLGAGDGTLLAELLTRHPRLRGIAFERPAVIPHTRRVVEERGVADRCTLVAGSLLTDVPGGADLYVLKSVIHNWDDTQALTILRACRVAAGDRGRLLVIDNAPDMGAPLAAALADLSMLVLFGGRNRTIEEHRALLLSAGFTVVRTISGPSGLCLLEATPTLP